MNITGNKKVDPWLNLGIVGLGVYASYRILNSILDKATPPVGQTISLPPGCSISPLKKLSIKQAMDLIYSKHAGANLWNYPNEVNVILGYDLCELQFGNAYFSQTYGQTIYQNIIGEWDLDGDYTPALTYLKSSGLGY